MNVPDDEIFTGNEEPINHGVQSQVNQIVSGVNNLSLNAQGNQNQ